MNLTTAIDILLPAFLAGLLVIATHVPLGQQVLRRGIVFIDLAIAQVAGLGVIAAHSLGLETAAWTTQLAAVSAALLAAAALTWSDARWPQVQEALIGVLFILAASASVLLLAHNPQSGERLQELLVGQILWVTADELLPTLLLYSVVLALWFGVGERLGNLGFYALFALTVTASVQLVGVYLVFATLIVPALATRAYPASLRLRLGYALGVAGYLLGLWVSAVTDLPSGTVIVWTLALLAVPVAGYAPTCNARHRKH